jgi:hypothetical protein
MDSNQSAQLDAVTFLTAQHDEIRNLFGQVAVEGSIGGGLASRGRVRWFAFNGGEPAGAHGTRVGFSCHAHRELIPWPRRYSPARQPGRNNRL